MTGAPLPPGAEAVVPVEWTDGGLGEGPVSGMRAHSAAPDGASGQVHVHRPAEARAHVRAKGSDVKAGDRALEGRHDPRPAADRPARRDRPRHRTRAPAPARGRPVHRQRTRPARRAVGHRPDLRLQQLRPVRSRPRRRGHRLPGGRGRRRRRDAPRHHRGPAHPRGPGGHHGRRERRRVRRRQGGPVLGGRRGRGGQRHRLPQARHAARQTPGLRHDRPRAHPAARAPRQPRLVVRLLRAVRPPRDPHPVGPGRHPPPHHQGDPGGGQGADLAGRPCGSSCAGGTPTAR